MIVCDTSPLVAAALSNDADHAACVQLLTDMHAAGRDLLVRATVAAEVGYLLAREAGPRAESLFLRSLAGGDFPIVDLAAADYSRMAGWRGDLSPHRYRCSGDGIELALSAWESDRSTPLRPLTCQDQAPPVPVTARVLLMVVVGSVRGIAGAYSTADRQSWTP